VLSLAVHWRAIRRPFFLDDWGYLYSGWTARGVLTYLQHPAAIIYRPLLELWFALGELVLGARALPFHLASWVLLLIAALLLHRLARAIGLPPGAAWVAAAVLALHPALDSALGWVSAVNALLVLVFCLAVLLLLLPAEPSRWHVALAAIGSLLALASREDAVVLPVVAVILRACVPELARLPLRSRIRAAAVPTWPVWLVVTAVAGLRRIGTNAAGADYETGIGTHVLRNLLRLWQFLLAIPLLRPAPSWNVAGWRAATLVAIVLLVLVAVLVRREQPVALGGLLVALVAMLPSATLTRHPMDAYYVALAVLGLALSSAGFAAAVAARLPAHRASALVPAASVLATVLMAVLAAQAGKIQLLRSPSAGQIDRQNQLLGLVSRRPPHAAVLCLVNGRSSDTAISVAGDLYRVADADPTLGFTLFVDGKRVARWGGRPDGSRRRVLLLVDRSPEAPAPPLRAPACV
jgi:hypothetical protein